MLPWSASACGFGPTLVNGLSYYWDEPLGAWIKSAEKKHQFELSAPAKEDLGITLLLWNFMIKEERWAGDGALVVEWITTCIVQTAELRSVRATHVNLFFRWKFIGN